MMNNDMNNIMKAVELEMELKQISQSVDTRILLNDAYMEYVDKAYENKLRDLELVENIRRKMTDLVILITKLKDIEHQAIVIKDMELYWKCENKITKMINQMELMRSKYDY